MDLKRFIIELNKNYHKMIIYDISKCNLKIAEVSMLKKTK